MGEEPVVDEQGTQVVGFSFRCLGLRVESFVGQRCFPARESGQKGLDCGGALPGDDAFGPVCLAEDIDDFARCSWIGRVRGQ
ncbi:hypothetical protein GCM10023346_47870 [Arthrobacter gyeryongensis]|uniref:Uncharacterized protein n=1 Tax=Arthrobacter gyeryongensis TaxID=1650592 RepID=A0ABP9SWK6_9MICC